MANWKMWWIMLAVAALLAGLAQGVPQPRTVDGTLLDALALANAEGGHGSMEASALRWLGTPPGGSPERAAAAWPWLLAARDFLGLALGWTLLAGLARFFPKKAMIFLGVAVLGLVAYGAWRGVQHGPGWDRAAGQLPSVGDSLRKAWSEARAISGDAPVWVNLTAARWLTVLDAQGAVPLTPEKQRALSRQAGQPRAWRIANRTDGYGAVVLVGPTAEYRPLLDHLLNSPDWTLQRLYPYAMVFRRGSDLQDASLWEQEADLEKNLPDPTARAVYLARVAAQAAEVGRTGEARRLFQQALTLAPHRAEVQALHASFLASRGEWAAAVSSARALLEEHPRYLPAWQVLVQAELAGHKASAAWEAAEKMLALDPKDPFSLFLMARAAHAAGATFAEVEALERLIRVSQRRGLPAGHYFIYLGQAQAKQGLLDQATQSFQTALAEESLSGEARTQVERLLEEVRAAQATGNPAAVAP